MYFVYATRKEKVMNINAKLEERTSKEGNPYFCIVIKLTENAEKIVFLNSVELELLRLTYGNSSQKIKMSNQNS